MKKSLFIKLTSAVLSTIIMSFMCATIFFPDEFGSTFLLGIINSNITDAKEDEKMDKGKIIFLNGVTSSG
ncbi:hypothetical protein [Paenibacillus taichungensis]|uniref:hypothetical protein n=1 Tax=Paenibacillus taichungensis TaxID=484184 RepID=UPI003D9A5DE5